MNRCEHGVYISDSDVASGKSWGCDLCWPEGRPETQMPVLPRSSADTLGRQDSRENCSKCGNLRTYFTKACRHCGESFPETDLRGKVQTTANRRHNVGACPVCGSAIHYETGKKSKWECADCGAVYSAPQDRKSSQQRENYGVD